MSEIEPLSEFLVAVAAARPEDYVEALDAGARFADITPEEVRAEFPSMKAYLLARYEGVQPVGSYRDTTGQVVDCIPFEQQPAVRAALQAGRTVARTAPPAPVLRGERSEISTTLALTPVRVCPEGTVGLVRYTLEELVRFGTLANFQRRHP